MPASDIVVTIPSGRRYDKSVSTVRAWKDVGFDVYLYAWDEETAGIPADKVFTGRRISFAKAQNLLASRADGYIGIICGADDLYPDNVSQVTEMCRLYDGKLLWADDGYRRASMTHPVVTRGWYDRYGGIFDEQFEHNFCDTDLFHSASRKGEVIKCFNISFDHRHYMRDGAERDEIYALGESTFDSDRDKFYEKHKGSFLGFVKTHGA